MSNNARSLNFDRANVCGVSAWNRDLWRAAYRPPSAPRISLITGRAEMGSPASRDPSSFFHIK